SAGRHLWKSLELGNTNPLFLAGIRRIPSVWFGIGGSHWSALCFPCASQIRRGGVVGLTVKEADGLKLKPGQKERIEFDEKISGFGLRIREGGSRTWIYQYRIGKKQRRMVLGSAKSVPLGLARENASKLEAKVKLGGDPAMDKEAA